MSPNPPPSPIIVIGMHRSGTTMVTRALEQLGVFMGAGLSHNAESELVVALNNWLLWQGSGAWDHPEPFRDVLASEPVREMSVDYLRTVLGSPRSGAFVGASRVLRGVTALELDAPWGLKDPRMTYTLPLWRELWPDAQVVSVVRHGVDVASSLQVRVRRTVAAATDRYRRRRWSNVLLPRHARYSRFVSSLRCAELDGGLRLWDEYASTAAGHVAELGPRAIQLRYEDVLQDPRDAVRQLAAFCGLPAPESRVSAIATGIDGGRAFAFEGRPELRAFAARDHVVARLRRHGYEPSPCAGAAVAAG